MEGNEKNNGQMPKGGRLVFGIFMVIVYLAMGLLFIFDVLMIGNTTITTIVGAVLIIYGIWRGYRLYKGMN